MAIPTNSRAFKDTFKSLLRRVGYDIVPRHFPAGSFFRPVGDMRSFLEDLRARGFRPRSIVDAGVWRAEWSTLASSVFPEAILYLIEPLNEHPELVQRYLAAHPRARMFQVAAGSRVERRTIHRHVRSSFSGSSFLVPDVGHPDGGEDVVVDVVTIDELVRSGKFETIPELVKLDVQGFELEVLRGSSKLFGHTDCFILEVSLVAMHGPDGPLFAEIVEFMKSRGYVAYDFPGFHRRPNDGAVAQVDIAFVRENSPLRSHAGYE